ncbi:WD40 repeat domain-containing protein [Gemmata sp.]|uniref:WD40 repeat domain-containing protein n=1 Tax=Gemmata sp. TaxID=1914242 RepID=UPI003F6E9046
MNLLSRASLFALGPLVSHACRAVGVAAVGDGALAVSRFVADRVSDQSLRVVEALAAASERAWRSLEVALAGESLATALDRAEDRALREQVRLFVLKAQLDGRADPDPDFAPRCLAELRVARDRGATTGGVDPDSFGDLTRFADPAGLLAAEWKVADDLAGELGAGGFPTLAVLVALRPPGDPAAVPLLAATVRHHFQRVIENDQKLFQGLAFAQLERIGRSQEQGAAKLAEQLARIEGRLGELHSTLAPKPPEPVVHPREMARPVVPEGQSNGVVAVSPDGAVAACGSPYDGKVRVIDAATGKELRRLAGHASWVTCVAFSPDSKRIASGGRDGAVKLWELATGRLVRTVALARTVPAVLVFGPTGRALTATGEDGSERTWFV